MVIKYMKKKFNIINHQANANQNYIEILSHLGQNNNKCWKGGRNSYSFADGTGNQ
jgi:hypothetical protein